MGFFVCPSPAGFGFQQSVCPVLLSLAGMQAAGSLGLVVWPSPEKVWVPLLPTYAMVSEMELFNCRWIARFQASMVGKRFGSSRIFTLSPLGIGINPFEGMAGKTKAAGPTARLNAAVLGPL